MEHMHREMVTGVVVDDRAPNYGRNVDGYGRKIPTAYRLQCTDGRTRRVYVVQYSNMGSLYVVVNGTPHYLASEVEHLIEDARNTKHGE